MGIFSNFDMINMVALGRGLRFLFLALGVIVVGYGLWKLIEASQNGKQQGMLGFWAIFMGGILMSSGYFISMLSSSFGANLSGADAEAIRSFSYFADTPTSGSAATGYQAIYGAVLNLVVLFGYWSFGKGVLLLKKTSDGASQHIDEGALSAGTHIFFGAALVNIRDFMAWFLTNFLGFSEAQIRSIFAGAI